MKTVFCVCTKALHYLCSSLRVLGVRDTAQMYCTGCEHGFLMFLLLCHDEFKFTNEFYLKCMRFNISVANTKNDMM